MKIEEAKEKIEKLQTLTIRDELINGFHSELIGKSNVLNIINQLDKPKPVVPQFVADWYEEHKDNFYLNLHRLAWELIENLDEDDFVPKKALDSDFKRWYHKTETAIQTLINMHQFGYTVEKEKLFTVEIPDPNSKDTVYCLFKDEDGQVKIGSVLSLETEADDSWRDDPDMQLTEQEIRKDFEWAWRWKKEVRE